MRVLVALLPVILQVVVPPPAHALALGQSLASAAAELSAAPAAARTALVVAAVAELAAAHAALGRAQGPDAGKAARWRRATQAYVARLHAAAAAARDGARVRLVVEPDQSLRVVVGHHPARQFMVSAPHPDDRPRLERAILRRLCGARACSAATLQARAAPTVARDRPPLATARGGAPAALAALPFKPEPVVPRLLGTLPPGDDGLRCAAHEARHRLLHERACRALFSDARALLAALHDAARRGIVIDWDAPPRLRPAGAAQVLDLNARGEQLRLALPALSLAPELLPELLSWARARLVGTLQPTALRPPGQLVYGAAVAAR